MADVAIPTPAGSGKMVQFLAAAVGLIVVIVAALFAYEYLATKNAERKLRNAVSNAATSEAPDTSADAPVEN